MARRGSEMVLSHLQGRGSEMVLSHLIPQRELNCDIGKELAQIFFFNLSSWHDICTEITYWSLILIRHFQSI